MKTLVHKNCVVKYKNVKKSKTFWLFWSPCGNSFFTKLHLSPQTSSLDNEIIRGWKYLTFWSVKSSEIWQKLHENVKNRYILKLLSFLVANCTFFHQKLRLFPKKALLTTNLFLVQRLWSSKPPRLSKITQKRHKYFKKWVILCFCQFRSKFDAFFQHQLLLSLQRSNHDNEFVPYWLSSTF